jgi:hypothetical protein
MVKLHSDLCKMFCTHVQTIFEILETSKTPSDIVTRRIPSHLDLTNNIAAGGIREGHA